MNILLPLNPFQLKLKARKGTIAATIISGSIIDAPLPVKIKKPATVSNITKLIPPARPSIPSIILNALITPTTQMIVKKYPPRSSSTSPVPKMLPNEVI